MYPNIRAEERRDSKKTYSFDRLKTVARLGRWGPFTADNSAVQAGGEGPIPAQWGLALDGEDPRPIGFSRAARYRHSVLVLRFKSCRRFRCLPAADERGKICPRGDAPSDWPRRMGGREMGGQESGGLAARGSGHRRLSGGAEFARKEGAPPGWSCSPRSAGVARASWGKDMGKEEPFLKRRDPRRGILALLGGHIHPAADRRGARMPATSSPERCAVAARQGAFLALPGDGKWAGISPSAQRPRGVQNPSPVLGGSGKFTTAGKTVRVRLRAGGQPGPRPCMAAAHRDPMPSRGCIRFTVSADVFSRVFAAWRERRMQDGA
jgi:hypothetical protein